MCRHMRSMTTVWQLAPLEQSPLDPLETLKAGTTSFVLTQAVALIGVTGPPCPSHQKLLNKCTGWLDVPKLTNSLHSLTFRMKILTFYMPT